MRILLVGLARRGGMVHFHAELANALVSSVDVDALTSPGEAPSYLQPKVKRLTVSTGQGPWGLILQTLNPLTWYGIWKAIRKSRADLVHITGVHAWNGMAAALVKLAGKKLVYTVHDPKEHPGSPFSIRLANLLALKMADAHIVLTRAGRRQLLSRGVAPRKVYVIPHGIYEFFRQEGTPGIRSGRVVLYFGRLEPYKGVEVLIEAFGRIRRQVPAWRLVVAGAGRLPAVLSGSRLEGVQVRNGFLPDGVVADLMRSTRLVVAPYTEASQSGVIAAAYAFDRPVIASRVGGLVEMVQHGKTGLLVPPNDSGALSRAMYGLMKNPSRLRQMARNIHSLHGGRFSWDSIARAHLKLYTKVLGGRPR